MPIITRCNNCGCEYRLHQELAGKTVRCRDCGKPIKVSQQDHGFVDDEAEAEVRRECENNYSLWDCLFPDDMSSPQNQIALGIAILLIVSTLWSTLYSAIQIGWPGGLLVALGGLFFLLLIGYGIYRTAYKLFACPQCQTEWAMQKIGHAEDRLRVYVEMQCRECSHSHEVSGSKNRPHM